jgi:hypothetical protein
MSGNEASAIGSMRAVNSAESTFSSSCAGGGHATSLAQLATAPSGSTAGFVSPDIATNGVVKSGYVVNVGPGVVNASVTLQASTCNNIGNAVSDYFAEAHPVTVGPSGQRSFGTDQRSTIFQNALGVAFTNATVASATTPIQ